MSLIIGIDPGLDGAIALISAEDNGLFAVEEMPTVTIKVGTKMKRVVSAPALAELIRSWDLTMVEMAVVEKVGAMPGQGVTSMFGFGKSAGIVEGVLAGLGVPYTLVTPQAWGKRACKGQGKDASRKRVMELYPSQAKLFSRVKDDGRAEAVLIARFGR